MSTKHDRVPRPWYCLDAAVDDYSKALSEGGDLRMLKALKILKSILVIVTIGAVSLYALYLGADPTLVALVALPGLTAYGAAEGVDYAALLQAYREAQQTEDDP